MLSSLQTREPDLVVPLVAGSLRGRHNEVEHRLGMGNWGSMAGVDFTGRGTHSPGHEPLGIWIDRPTILGDQVPGGRPFPGGAPDGAAKHPGAMGFCATARARASIRSTSCRKFCGKAAGSIQMNPERYEGTRCMASGGAGKCALMLWILSPSSGAYAAI